MNDSTYTVIDSEGAAHQVKGTPVPKCGQLDFYGDEDALIAVFPAGAWRSCVIDAASVKALMDLVKEAAQ